MLTEEQKIRLNELNAKRSGVSELDEQQRKIRLKELEDKRKTHALNVFFDGVKSLAADAFYPVKRVGQIYSREAKEGRAAVKDAYENPGWLKTPLGIVGGALQYTFAPVTAIAQGIVGEPVQESLTRAGVPEDVAKFAGKLGEEAVYFVPAGSSISRVMMASTPGLKAKEAAIDITKLASKKIPEGVTKKPQYPPTGKLPDNLTAKVDSYG